MASGRTAALTSEIQIRQYGQQSDSSNEEGESSSDMETGRDVDNAIDIDTGIGNERSSQRKRSATTHDPKKTVNTNKRTRHFDEFNEQIKNLVEVFKKPIEVSPIEMIDPADRWINEAHSIWREDFGLVDFEVAKVMFEEWSRNIRSAQIFVVSGDNYRKALVAHYERQYEIEHGI